MARRHKTGQQLYNYSWLGLIRFCGHVEDVHKPESTCPYEPTAKEWAEKEKCTACRVEEHRAHKAEEERVINIGRQYLIEHGLDPNDWKIESYGGCVEISKFISVK